MRWQIHFLEVPLVATFLAWIHLNFQPQPIFLNLDKICSNFNYQITEICSDSPILPQSKITDYRLFIQQSSWYLFYNHVIMSVDRSSKGDLIDFDFLMIIFNVTCYYNQSSFKPIIGQSLWFHINYNGVTNPMFIVAILPPIGKMSR
jgi:hypothetical protein